MRQVKVDSTIDGAWVTEQNREVEIYGANKTESKTRLVEAVRKAFGNPGPASALSYTEPLGVSTLHPAPFPRTRSNEQRSTSTKRVEAGDPKVFLCYRREDTQGFARGIYDSLAAKYGDKHVFRDIDSTPAGVRFSTWIQSTIGQCSVMAVLTGPTWASAKDQAGRRRLELPTDWV
jgi:TIR domain